MQRTSLRTRVVAGIATLAAAGGSLVLLAPPAMAAAADVTVTSANPFITQSVADQPIAALVLTEGAAGDIAVGDVCVEILGAAATWDGAGAIPTISENNAVATVSDPNIASPVRAMFTVDTASTVTAATYTFGGLRLDASGTSGQINAEVGDCTGDNDQYEATFKLAFIGEVTRTAGSDRYATAARIAFDEFDCLAGKTVVIARGDNFPDALAASYLAGQNGTPILLTAPSSIAPETANAIAHHGVTNVILVGGTAAISDLVKDAFDAMPVIDCVTDQPTGATLTVERLFGADRYVTAKAVAERPGLGAAGTADLGLEGTPCAAVKTAIVASGENFPDALAAGGLAYGGLRDAGPGCGDGPLPLLLTPAGSLSPSAAGGIDNLDIEQVILVGGPAAVSDVVKDAIDALPGVSVVRVAGANRQATAVAIAGKVGLDSQGDYAGTVLVSRPDTFPDALAASSLGGANGWPILLADSTSSLGTTAADGIKNHPNTDEFFEGILLGGEAALTPAVETQLGAALAAQ